jgi:hypothetical protein
MGIVSKGIREPVDRLTLFGGTFNVAILSKVIPYKHILLLCCTKGTLKSVNLLSRSVRSSRSFTTSRFLMEAGITNSREHGHGRKIAQLPLWTRRKR